LSINKLIAVIIASNILPAKKSKNFLPEAFVLQGIQWSI
jgi:hypothetical protein